MPTSKKYKIVGTSVIREDALHKVTGQLKFIDDYKFPNMLYGKVLFSKVPRAKSLKIDYSRALKIEGIQTILTAKDIPGTNVVPLIKDDWPFLANSEIRHIGEALALIAGESKEAIEEAVDKIKVSYEEIEPILTIEDSIKRKDDPILPDGNIISEYVIKKGDIKKGFEEADVVVQGEFRTHNQEHAYLEPQGMIAVPESDGTITVYGSMQCPFYVHNAVSRILGIPLNKVKVIQTPTGGGFGGKEDVPSLVAGWASLLAYHTKRPVKLILTREEDFISMSKRHASIVRHKLGAKKDGTLIACESEILFDGGAYSTLTPVVLWRGTIHMLGPYYCPNIYIKSYAYRTNKVPAGAFRGFGSPQVIFAGESLIDELAYKLNMDPLEFRRKNALTVGKQTATGHRLNESVNLIETIEAARKESNWEDKWKTYPIIKGNKARGIGISTIMYGVGLGAGGKKIDRSAAFVELHSDLSAKVSVGTTEIGQGMRTVLAQITAEALGIPYENVYIEMTDTSKVPDSGPTVASRSTFMSGNAILNACEKITNRMKMVAGKLFNLPPEKIYFENSTAITRTRPKQTLPLKKIVDKCLEERVPLADFGWFIAPFTSFDNKTGQGEAYYVYSFMTNIAEVEVDLKTGVVELIKMSSAVDIGQPINPEGVRGQIYGGVVQGLGYALLEKVIWENGKIINPEFATYIIPTIKDFDNIVPIIVPGSYSKGPYGAKGIGELPLMGIAPAVANAVRNALGIRFYEIPLLPELIFEKLINPDSSEKLSK